MAKSKKLSAAQKRVIEEKRRLSEQEEKSFLLFKPNELANEEGSDLSLDEFLEKTALINPTQYPRIIGERVAYESKFPLEFYRQIFKLWGWPVVSDECLRRRPGICAKITAYLIYMRFDKGVLKELQRLNKKNGDGVRLFKHFQWLTPEATELLKKYIREAEDLMKEHTSWNQFIKVFTVKYSNPYGLSWENY